MTDATCKCPKCGGRMRLSRVKHYGTFDEKRRDCKCGRADKIHVRIHEEVLAVIEVVKRAKREVRARTLSSTQTKKRRDNKSKQGR